MLKYILSWVWVMGETSVAMGREASVVIPVKDLTDRPRQYPRVIPGRADFWQNLFERVAGRTLISDEPVSYRGAIDTLASIPPDHLVLRGFYGDSQRWKIEVTETHGFGKVAPPLTSFRPCGGVDEAIRTLYFCHVNQEDTQGRHRVYTGRGLENHIIDIAGHSVCMHDQYGDLVREHFRNRVRVVYTLG